MSAEVIYDRDGPNRDGWLQKDQDCVASDRNWHRLGDIVVHNLFQTSGLRSELSRRQRRKIDRTLELALDPELPLTKREVRRANRGHEPGFPIWSTPILLGLIPVVKAAEAAEKYAEKGKFGSGLILRQRDGMDYSILMSETINNAASEVITSSLEPETRAGYRALELDTEPRDYVINMRDLLETAGDLNLRSGDPEEIRDFHILQPFADASPQLRSTRDQRAHAAGIFMGSTLLRDGELLAISRGQRADYLPDGPDTFRMHITNPYQYLYDQSPYSRESGHTAYPESPNILTKRMLNPNVIDQLLTQSQVS